MFSLEEQDEILENLKSYYGEDLDDLAGKVWDIKSGDNSEGLSSLSAEVDILLQEFRVTCEELHGIENANEYFELLLVDYDLPSLYEFGNE